MNFNKEELVDMIFILGECQKNSFLASRVYRERFPGRRCPQVVTFERLKQRFIETGNVCYEKHTRSKSILTEATQEDILLAIIEEPKRSGPEISQYLNIPRTTVRRTIKENKLHPYHIHVTQSLNDRDRRLRMNFAQWALDKINHTDVNFFDRVLFTDECTFHSNGIPNKHNYHHYAQENPHITMPINNQNRFSINVWAGIIGQHLIGPHFFEERLTGARYLEFLRNTLPELMEDVPLNVIRHMWFQHDGAPVHFTQPIVEFLNQQYPNQWIGRGGPILWPPRSPDKTKLDYFLWGFIKNVVYLTPATTREDMCQRIRNAFLMVTPQMLANVSRNFIQRMHLCVQQNGGVFEQLID